MEHKLAPIKREHIEEAARIIDKEGMPASYVGEYMVQVNDKTYHYKYITRLAYKLATGEEVEPYYFQSNENYRKKIIDLGFSVITQNQNIMIKNPFLLTDEKLSTLLKAYSDWLSKHPEEQSYNNRIKEDNGQIQETFLNPDYLDEVKNAQFKGDIKAYISKLDGPVGIRLGDPRITNNLTKLKNNFRYIIASTDDPFVVAQTLIDGKKKIEYFSKAFWSPILQARYPDVIPNWNNKTENLLAIFGVKVKTTKLNAEEKLRKISEAFQYLQHLDPSLDFFHLNHLMHFGYVIDEGKKLISDLLNESDPRGSDRKYFLKIYEIKTGAPDINYPKLKNSSQNAFFWNDAKFTSNNNGDFIVVVSRPNNEALFTTLVSKGIPARYNPKNNTSSFTHNGTEYSCDGEWKSFAHFEVLQKAALYGQWKWIKAIGQSEIYDLWKPKIDNIPDSIQIIDNLLLVFKYGSASKTLHEYRVMLVKKQIGNVLEKTLNNGAHQELIHSNEFYFTNARRSFDEFMAFDISSSQDRLMIVISQYKDQELSYVEFTEKITDSIVREFFELTGKFVAHVDYNGANKTAWNTTADKRVISKSLYTQKNWLDQLYKLKLNPSFNLSPTVQTVIDYLNTPDKYLPVTSENHKRLIAEKLLLTQYTNDLELTSKLKELFDSNRLPVNNPANFTRFINEALYNTDLKAIWDNKHMDENQSSIGLVASDSGSWPEEAIQELTSHNHIIIWWDKLPSGGKKVLQLIKQTIKNEQFLYIYLSANHEARYKIKVVDYAIAKDYMNKIWNLNEDVAWYSDKFEDYTGDTKSGKIRKAQIAFLADEIAKLDVPIPMKRFRFYQNYQPPTQNNLQPFVEIISEDTTEKVTPSVNNTTHNPQDIVKHIHKYASGQGFKYHANDIANFYLSLKTKPFVILAGISGTGKTKLVEFFAESIGYGDREHCVIIPVKPDWTDNSDLMGYTNLNKEFEKKKLTEVILNAHKNPDEPFFIILDEMNLARVEHYFSDFLSIIETRSLKDDKIRTKPLLYGSEVGDNTRERESLINIGIPENLYIIGTVNMDETTFPFSKKVLDRANSIEMNQVELDFIQQAEEIKPMNGVFNDFLRSDKINSKHLSEEDHLLLVERKFTEELMKINDILARVDLQFAYRIRDEMAFYLLNSDKISEIINWEEAMDYQVMQKILPRIQGSAISVSYLLINLINHFMGENGKFEEKSHYEDIKGVLQKYIASDPKYSRTLKKLDFMLRRYSQDGFTSFWI